MHMQEHMIHEHKLLDLVERLNFTQAIYYTWTGKFPTPEAEALFNACLIALIDHGPEALSAKASRVSASGGADMHAAVAAGLLAAGKHHGASVLQIATAFLRKAVEAKLPAKDVVANSMKAGTRIAGFGHRVYTTDPRAQALLARADKLGFTDAHVKLALDIEKELEAQRGKKLCLNVDGVIAALLPGLGIAPELAPGVFLVSRSVGLIMHVAEEQKEKPASQRQK